MMAEAPAEEVNETLDESTKQMFEEAKKLMDDKKDGKVKAIKYLSSKLDNWKKAKVFCGVTGSSGSGKSSFCNAIRNVQDADEGAAATDVEECTTEPTDYQDPFNPLLIYSDLPGVGTPNNPKATYVTRMRFERYDFFLIMSSTRFTEEDQWLAGKIKELKKPFFFVRTKIDQDIYSNNRKGISAEETKNSIRRKLEANLKATTEADKSNIYLISNYEQHLHDFSRLVKDIVEILPRAKSDALLFSLQTFSVDILHMKMKALYLRANLVAALSGGGALIPAPGVGLAIDTALIIEEFMHYHKQLAVNGQHTFFLKGLVKGTVETLSKKELLAQTTKIVAQLAVPTAVENAAKFVVPIIGFAIAGTISFFTTRSILHNRIKKLGDETESFIQTAGINELKERLEDA